MRRIVEVIQQRLSVPSHDLLRRVTQSGSWWPRTTW